MKPIYTAPYLNFPVFSGLELRGTEGMRVVMINKPTDPYYAIATGQSASFRPWRREFSAGEKLKLVEDIGSGRIWAGQAFESINFTFLIDNISRVTTHQLVRTRIGAGYMQESGRDGTWGKANFVVPLTILENESLHLSFVNAHEDQVAAYDYMISKGIPPQDSRFCMPHATAQNMWVTMNFVALMQWCGKRLCTGMQWEINTLARLMRDEVIRHFPHLGVLLKSNCERSGGCKHQNPAMLPGAANNGNRVYYSLEGELCGQASAWEPEEIELLKRNELERL